jgi:hypothetical protein
MLMTVFNSEHPFMKLIIRNLDFFDETNNKLYLELFITSFGPLLMGYDFNKLLEYQKEILTRLRNGGRISESEAIQSVIAEDSLPQRNDYNEDFV